MRLSHLKEHSQKILTQKMTFEKRWRFKTFMLDFTLSLCQNLTPKIEVLYDRTHDTSFCSPRLALS